jgi:hypothetical protein
MHLISQENKVQNNLRFQYLQASANLPIVILLLTSLDLT